MSTHLELLQVATDDGIVLDGSWAAPDSSSAHRPKLPVDAFLLVHGTGANFYSGGVLQTFANQALAVGVPVLRINTRGHDGISYLPTVAPRKGGSIHGGATFETIADCTCDITAWVNCLVQRGLRHVALVGHSMGGVKSIISQAECPHPAVCGVIAISPPRFCHAELLADEHGSFRKEFARARELFEAGQPEALMPVTQPVPHVATAAGYLEKYGPDDRYDLVRYLPRLGCPAMVLVGTDSMARSPAHRNLTEVIAGLKLPPERLAVESVAGANISFSGQAEVPFERSLMWLQKLSFTKLLQNGDSLQTPPH